MKYLAFFVLLCVAFPVLAQKSITIKVESLSKPKYLLGFNSYQTVLENLIREDNGVSRGRFDAQVADPTFNIVAQSKMPDSLVSMGYHSFFEGMYSAYADHRPFTLSPDMVWLLIS